MNYINIFPCKITLYSIVHCQITLAHSNKKKYKKITQIIQCWRQIIPKTPLGYKGHFERHFHSKRARYKRDLILCYILNNTKDLCERKIIMRLRGWHETFVRASLMIKYYNKHIATENQRRQMSVGQNLDDHIVEHIYFTKTKYKGHLQWETLDKNINWNWTSVVLQEWVLR